MSKAYSYYYRDNWVDDLQQLVSLDLTQSNVQVETSVTTSNLITDGLIQSSNILNTGTIETDALSASNITTSNITATSITASNITATQFLQGLTINAESNLCWGGHSLQQPYPGDPSDWDDIIPFSGDTEGLIHQSWIYKPLTAKDVLTDLWNIAETGIDIAEAVADAYQFFQGTGQQALTQAAVDAMSEALDNLGDETSSNPKIIVSWSNLKNKPIANNNTTIGIDGDLYVNPANSLKILDGGSFTTDVWNNTKFSATPSGSKIIDFNTKEAFLSQITLSNSERASIYQPDEIITDCNFKIGTLRMGFESASNTQLFNTQSNITVNDIVLKKDDYGITTLVSENIDASTFRDANNFNSALNFLSFESAWRFCDRYDTGAYSSNYQDWANTYLYVKPKLLEFKTQDRPIGGVGQPLVTHFSVNSNGTLYCRSNIQMNSPAVIRSVQTTIDDYPREGLLKIEPTIMRYIQRSNVGGSNGDTINWSLNSNGMFLLQRNAIYGKTESAYSNFTRLEQTLENGLIWGRGLSNNFGTDADLFQFKQNGELYTADYTGTMKRHINSNAELQKGTMVIDNDGNLKVNGSNLILSSGTIQRRANPESNTGFQVSPSGYLTMGKLGIDPDGVLNSTASATFSNLTASNINAVTITAVNINESNLFTSNVNAMAITSSNLTTETATVRQSLDVGTSTLTLSNNQIFFKSGATSNMIIGANTINNINNGTFTVSHPSQTSLSIYNDGRLMLYNNKSTSLGINSTFQEYPLTIRNNSINGDSRSGIAFGATTVENQTPGHAIWFSRTAGNGVGDLTFVSKTDSTQGSGPLSARMIIKSDGKVGIGTTTPTQLLDVAGTTNASNFTEGGVALSNKYALSNAQSNYATTSNFGGFSNWTSCNMTTLSNWTDATFRKKATTVTWDEISGKPNFGTSNNSIDFAGVALGSAGLLFGGAALLNQNGQLTSALQNVAGTLSLASSGYSRMDEGLKLLGDGVNGITLDPSGSISALTGAFNYSRFTGGVDIGTLTMSLSNDKIYWKSGSNSNMIMGSNSITVLNNQPFTISNANVISTCNVSAPSFTEGSVALSNKYVLSNAQSNFALGSTVTTFSNWSSCNFVGLSNTYSNLNSNYGGFSNYLTPKAEWTSNSLSNFTTQTTYNSFSNWVSPLASNNRNWTNNTSNVITFSNVGIGTSNPTYMLQTKGSFAVGEVVLKTHDPTSAGDGRTATSYVVAGNDGSRAFDTDPNSFWWGFSGTQWISIQPRTDASAILLTSYTIAAGNNNNCVPNSWILQGANDSLTSSSWVNIDTQSSASLGTYQISPTVAYKYYRFVINSVSGGGGYTVMFQASLTYKEGSITMAATPNVGVAIGKSNASYDLDVSGTANATVIREGTTLLSDKYALSNAQSNFALGSTLSTFSNWSSCNYIGLSNTYSNFTTSNFPSFSNATWCNLSALSNTLSNFTTSNFGAFSNWSSCNYIGLSNAYSNFTLTTYPAFSNATWSNMVGLSNWTNSTFRKTATTVTWDEISGKPSFGTSNSSIDFAGVALGSAGLLFGGLALFNQYGQIASTLQNASGTLKLATSGYSHLDEGLKLLGDGVNGITLDPSGSISALTGVFNYSRFTGGVDIGTLTMSLSNDRIYWKSGSNSNMIMGSNSITVLNNQPFTISNANVISSCNVSAPSFTEGGVALSNKYVLSNAQSNFALGSTLTTFSNFSSCNFVGLSNAYSNLNSNYGGFSNYLTPISLYGSNAHSNYTTLTAYNGFSNWVSPKSEWASNALSNYTPIVSDKYWTFSNSMIYTTSNVSIGRTSNFPANITFDVFNSNNSGYTAWFQDGSSNQFLMAGANMYHYSSNGVTPQLWLGDLKANGGYSNTQYNINFKLNDAAVPTAQIIGYGTSNYGGALSFTTKTRGSNVNVERFSVQQEGAYFSNRLYLNTPLKNDISASYTVEMELSSNLATNGMRINDWKTQFIISNGQILCANQTSATSTIPSFVISDIRTNTGNSNNNTRLQFYTYNSGEPQAQIVVASDCNCSGHIQFLTRLQSSTAGTNNSSTEKMRISSTGYVGIGVSNPSTWLDVYGGAKLGGGLRIYDSTDTNAFISALDYPMVTDTSRYIAFGRSNGTYNEGQLTFYYKGNASQSNRVGLGLNGTTPLWVNAYGNVGIGTSTPTAQLQTTGNAIINNASIGVVGSYGSLWAGFANSSRMSDGNYAILQNNDGMTLLNSSSGQGLEFRQGNVTKGSINTSGRWLINGGGMYIDGSTGVYVTAYYYYSGGGSAYYSGAQTINYSLQTTGRIICPEMDATCDKKLKKNINLLGTDDCLEAVKKMKPRKFKWKDQDDSAPDTAGIVAQEMLEAFPNCVKGIKLKEDDVEETLTVNFNQITTLNIGAIQALTARIEALEAEIKTLKNKKN